MQNMLLQNKNIIGMDIGGTNCRIALVNEKLSISKLKVINSREIFYSDDSVNILSYVIEQYIKNELEGKSPDLISIGFPSVLDKTRKNMLLDILNQKIQTFITTTSIDDINHQIIERAKKIYIESGKEAT